MIIVADTKLHYSRSQQIVQHFNTDGGDLASEGKSELSALSKASNSVQLRPNGKQNEVLLWA
jgi:hypothetical protein